jgi:hypothetical protein
MKRTYQIPMTGRVVVDREAGEVEISVDLVDLPLDLTYDYEVGYTKAEIQADGDLIHDLQSSSLAHHYLMHRMSKCEEEGR